MIGIDTSFLVAWAIPEHTDHQRCRSALAEAARQGRTFGLTAGILAEFIHVVTDARRFTRPLSTADAVTLAEFWGQAAEVRLLLADGPVTRLWSSWLILHRLGRKRLLDTLIAATWHHHGITEIYTLNPDDFTIFQTFTSLLHG